MIPVGYMAKHVFIRPDWLKAGRVGEIYSVSRCISEDFGAWIECWKHNGYWFFDSPGIIREVATELDQSLEGTGLFYYEAHELEFDIEERQWFPFVPDPSFPNQVVPPVEKVLKGFDVVSFSLGNAAECSPLSCNSLATSVETNEHCLLSRFEDARHGLEAGTFDNSEPGPFRIFAVYATGWP